MSRSPEELRAALSALIDEAMADHVETGEIISTWLIVAGTRDLDGGGAVLVETATEAMPQWEVRGLLATAQRSVDRVEGGDQ